MLYKFKGSFFNVFEESAKYFSKKYNCHFLFGTDEISFVIENPLELFEDLDYDKTNHSNEVISLFPQYFFIILIKHIMGIIYFFIPNVFLYLAEKLIHILSIFQNLLLMLLLHVF